MAWLLVVVLFAIVKQASHAQDAPPTITSENVGQVKALLSLVSGLPDNGRIILSSDGRLMAMTGYVMLDLYRYRTDRPLYNIQTGERLPMSGPGMPMAFSTDGRLLVLNDNWVTRLWDVQADREKLSVIGLFVAMSRDGMYMVTDSNGFYWLWGTATGQSLTGLKHAYGSASPQFSPDGAYLAWLAADRTVHLWDIGANVERSIGDLKADRIAFSPLGQFLALAGPNGFGLLDLRSGQLGTYLGSDRLNQAFSLDFSFDGKVVVIVGYARADGGTFEQQALILDAADGSVQGALKLPKSSSQEVTLSRDGKLVLVRDIRELTLRGWSLVSRHEISPVADVLRVTFSPDGTWIVLDKRHAASIVVDSATWTEHAVLAAGSYSVTPDQTAILRIVRDVILVYGIPSPIRPAHPLTLPAHTIASIYLRASPSASGRVIGSVNGNVLVGGRKDGFAYLVDKSGWVNASPAYLVLEGGLSLDLVAEIDPSSVLAGGPTPTPTSTPRPPALPTGVLPGSLPSQAISLPVSGVPSAPLPGLTPITGTNADQVRLLGVIPTTSVFDYDGKYSLISADGRVYVDLKGAVQPWDLGTLSRLPPVPASANSALAVSRDGALFAYTSGDDVVVWDVRAGRTRVILHGHSAPVTSLAFSVDSKLLATWAGGGPEPDFSLRLWDTATGIQRLSIPLLSGNVLLLAFSVDGALLYASPPETGTVVWEIATGSERLRLPVAASHLTFSPDGKAVIVAGPFAGITVWDTVSRQRLFADKYAVAADFSPDGRLAATVSDCSAVKCELALWATDSWTRRAYLAGTQVRFSADGRHFLTWGSDHALRLWNAGTLQPEGGLLVDWDGPWLASADGHFLVFGTILLDLASWQMYAIPGHYAGGVRAVMSGDNTTLTLVFTDVVEVFGIPSAARPAWQPVLGHVKSSGISLRAGPAAEARIIGTASGKVTVSGRDGTGLFIYLPDAKGWVWADYVDLANVAVRSLPIVSARGEQ